MITETSRLKIRELTSEDAAFILALTNEPATIENIGDKGLRSVADAQRFISSGPWTAQQKPGYGQFAIELKHSGELISMSDDGVEDVQVYAETSLVSATGQESSAS